MTFLIDLIFSNYFVFLKAHFIKSSLSFADEVR